MAVEGEGVVTRTIYRFMACDEPQLNKLFLAGLPPVFKIDILWS